MPNHVLPVGATFERYEIESLIGRGGMGEVYRAVDTRLRRKVALKVLRPDRDGGDAVARLFREARSAAGLAHPNTVAIHDLGEAEGIFYIVMELVAGVSLLTYVGDDRAPTARKLGWLVDVARALSAAHKAGVIHRDVKPSNVMVSDDDIVKVLDFGLAKPMAPVSFRTQAGHVLGTPRYMSPEAFAGAEADARSDQYAYGLTAYELVAGRHPGGVLAGPEPPPALDTIVPAISRLVASVIARTLEIKPDDRFASMDDVAVALEDAIAGRPPRGGAQADAAGVRVRTNEPNEITEIEAPLTNAPLVDTMRFGSDAQARPAESTKRAGGGDVAVVAKVDALAVTMAGDGHTDEAEVPTLSAKATGDLMADTLANPSELGDVMIAPAETAGPNGTVVDPGGMVAGLGGPPQERTLLSREQPSGLVKAVEEARAAYAAKTMVTPGNDPGIEVVAAELRAEKEKNEADAKARADAKAVADADAKAKAHGDVSAMDRAATTGAARSTSPAGVAKPRKPFPLAAIALVVLGICAFAGAYYGSKQLTRPSTPPATPTPSMSASAPAASAATATATAMPTTTTTIVPLLPLGSSAAPIPTPTPTLRKPKRAPIPTTQGAESNPPL